MSRNSFARLSLFLVLLTAGILSGCKKDKINKPSEPDTPTVTAADLSKDSLYYLFKDEYLFTENIPSYEIVNPRGSKNLDSLFNKLVAYQTNPTDRYSFLDKTGSVASEIGQGVSQGDFGLEIFYPSISDLRVKYVVKGSPAYTLGIRKGWQILAINDNTSIAYDGTDAGGTGTNLNRIINAVYYSTSVKVQFQKPDGSTTTLNIASTSYTIDPLVFDSVYTLGGKKIGYFVLTSFVEKAKIKTELDALFTEFSNKNVTDLVVDLRYNGGGAVSTSEYLANLIAPKSVGTDSTKLMYRYQFNSRVTSGLYSAITKGYKLPAPDQAYSWADLFDSYNYYAKTNFKKAGNLDIKNVVFIVTSSTASASELLINNLTPYMNVTLIGKTTYGKPVGFIGIPIGGYTMYAISFKTVNANSYGDYYTGMIPSVDLYEDYKEDFGQLDEVYLNQACKSLGVTSGLPTLKAARVAPVNLLYNSKFDRGFKGMIETRRKR